MLATHCPAVFQPPKCGQNCSRQAVPIRLRAHRPTCFSVRCSSSPVDAGDHLRRHGTTHGFSEESGTTRDGKTDKLKALPAERTVVDGESETRLDLGLTVVGKDGSVSFFDNWSEKTEDEKLAIARVVIPRNRKRLAHLREIRQQELEQGQEQAEQ